MKKSIWISCMLAGLVRTSVAPLAVSTKMSGVLDIKGFSSSSGEPLPNDDLDLRLVWLCAMEAVRPSHFSTNSLAERWLDWLPPHWNEYGICKANLRQGLLPPLRS